MCGSRVFSKSLATKYFSNVWQPNVCQMYGNRMFVKCLVAAYLAYQVAPRHLHEAALSCNKLIEERGDILAETTKRRRKRKRQNKCSRLKIGKLDIGYVL